MKPSEISLLLERANAAANDLPDGDEHDDDAPLADGSAFGFVELFYLWCATYQVGSAALFKFDLSPTRLTACENPGNVPE